jgi:hypothetical protein
VSLSVEIYFYKNHNIPLTFFRALDRNEYNHITATYFLLAERKLRLQQQQSTQKLNLRKKPDLSLQLTSPTTASG